MPDSLVQFSSTRARARVHVADEAKAFADDVRHAELTMQLAISALLIKRGCDTERNREVGNDRIRETLEALVGPLWADIRRRMDEEGGAVEPFPTLGD